MGLENIRRQIREQVGNRSSRCTPCECDTGNCHSEYQNLLDRVKQVTTSRKLTFDFSGITFTVNYFYEPEFDEMIWEEEKWDILITTSNERSTTRLKELSGLISDRIDSILDDDDMDRVFHTTDSVRNLSNQVHTLRNDIEVFNESQDQYYVDF